MKRPNYLQEGERGQWTGGFSEVTDGCGGWSWISKLMEVVISLWSIWIHDFRNGVIISDDKGYSVTLDLWVAEMEKIRSLEKRKKEVRM